MSQDPALLSLLSAFQALPAPPEDRGGVSLVVLREPGEVRTLPASVLLDPVDGTIGDRWALGKRDPDAQVTLMRADVARMLVREAGIEVFGDNLFVTLDTSRANLPAGTRLRIGEALVEVTPKPHRGCHKFAARAVPFGRDLLDLPELLPLQLRGVHVRVIVGGAVKPGDLAVVEARP